MDFKRILIAVVLTACTLKSEAQTLIGAAQITTKDTVPQGQLWKIESILYDGLISSTSSSINSNDYFLLNGNVIYCRQAVSMSYPSPAAVVWEMKYPFWISEGDIIEPKSNVGKISILKFQK